MMYNVGRNRGDSVKNKEQYKKLTIDELQRPLAYMSRIMQGFMRCVRKTIPILSQS